MNHQQLHQRLTNDQVKTIIASYLNENISSKEAGYKLEIGKTRFFALVKKYCKNPKVFNINYQRAKSTRGIDPKIEKYIIKELKVEKWLIANKNIPIKNYNYSAVHDTLINKYHCRVSLQTIINRAKDNGYYLTKRSPQKPHDREVLTSFIGELLQHDSSHHQFSPYMADKLYLITTLDDYSRLLLFADLIEAETTWNHISALKSVVLQYGCPLKYYTDQHSIFRFVQGRDKQSPWKTFTKFTDDVDTQFKQVLNDCNIGTTYALSPQAKGKVERPYRWIQDRLVRSAAKEKITTLKELKNILRDLVNQYNTKWVHSTTKEIPIIRFEQALNSQHCLFKPFKLIKGNKDINDIFCLRGKRTTDAYRRISINGLEIPVPNCNPREEVDLRMVPDFKNKLVEIRFWQEDNYLGSQKVKLDDLPIVHF